MEIATTSPPRSLHLPRTLQAFVVLILTVATLAAGYRTTLTPITLVVDGQSRQLRTHQDTVAALLTDAGVQRHPGDIIAPAPETSIQPGMIIRIDRARPVEVSVDGQRLMLETHATSINQVLQEARVTLGPHDALLVDGNLRTGTSDSKPARIVIHRALPFTLHQDRQTTTFYTTAPTVGEALRQAGLTLYLADHVRPELSARLSPGMEVFLERSTPVTIRVDGRTVRTRTHREHASDVLADLGIVLTGQDYVNVSVTGGSEGSEGSEAAEAAEAPEAAEAAETPEGTSNENTLAANAIIEVVRVSERFLIEQEPIPFESVWRPDPELEIDHQRLVQEGSPGVRERRIRVHYENGHEVSRTVENEYVAVPPTTNIRGYGTKIVVRSLSTPSGTREYWRTIRMLATSYSAATSGVSKSNPHYGRTATGLKMRDGIVAVDPQLVSLGSEVYVPGYGVGFAGDIGGAVKGKRIDLGYADETLQLWYRWVDVYLLTPVPPADQIDYTLP
ncbi:MAG: ubiquitin-like domain-containing protein [Anaerolineae bacterium]|jgi:uncharacterized protein YabE (DUF348 family)